MTRQNGKPAIQGRHTAQRLSASQRSRAGFGVPAEVCRPVLAAGTTARRAASSRVKGRQGR